MTVLDEAARRGVNVPEDLSIVGFDGTADGARTSPALTTVAHPIAEKGKRAVEIILANGPPQQIVLPVKLVARGTTAHPSASTSGR